MKLKVNRRFDCILLGFLLFFIGDNVTIQIIEAGIKSAGWFFIILGFLNARKISRPSPISRSYILLVSLYAIQCIIMIVRGYTIDYPFQWKSAAGCINFHLFFKYYLLPYIMPLTLFIDWREIKLDKFCLYASAVAIASAIMMFLNINSLSSASHSASMEDSMSLTSQSSIAIYTSFAFAVLLFSYITAQKWGLNLMGLLCSILVFMITARRGNTLICAILLIFCIVFFLKGNKRINKKLLFTVMAVLVAGILFTVMNADLFSFIIERGLEDNRSAVDLALLSQSDTFELIFGKGLNGRYFFPLEADNLHDGWRYGSETGFFNLVLKGGFLLAFTYIVMLLIPAFKGMFKSRNMLCRVGGFYIFLSLLELYPFGWLEFSVKFLIIWAMILLCMNHSVREMTDDEVRQQFFSRKNGLAMVKTDKV